MNHPARNLSIAMTEVRKDRSLDLLAKLGNVAQFVSFAPQKGKLVQTYSRVLGFDTNFVFETADVAVTRLLEQSADGAINVRSFTPDNPRSREFIYGIVDRSKASDILGRLANEDLFVILNETVDVSDGGVSGVVEGNIIEFAPDDTPRCVEKPGVASLPRDWGLSILSKVYRIRPDLPEAGEARLEFSLHPKPRGWRGTHTLTWEYETVPSGHIKPLVNWPNRFSRLIGDKVFGLLVAEEIGVPVPQTTVICRRIAPFQFGSATGSAEIWTRTCPREPEPGKYTTTKGWVDPFELLKTEDAEGGVIASVLSQAAIPAQYSGAAIVMANGDLVIEGRAGEGDRFMLGKAAAETLPNNVLSDVRGIFGHLKKALGPVRFEWVHDGETAWVVQLHRGTTRTTPTALVPGDPREWVSFDTTEGLEAFRSFLSELRPGAGVSLVGEIGLTSHVADVARKSKRPTRIVASIGG